MLGILREIALGNPTQDIELIDSVSNISFGDHPPFNSHQKPDIHNSDNHDTTVSKNESRYSEKDDSDDELTEPPSFSTTT